MADDKWIEVLAAKLKEHRSEVGSDLWQGISSRLGANVSIATVGLGFAKTVGIICVAAVALVVTYFSFNVEKKEEASTKKEKADNITLVEEKIIREKSTINTAAKEIVTLSVSIKEKNINKEAINVTQQEVLVAIEKKTENKNKPEIITPRAPEIILSKSEKIIEKEVSKSLIQTKTEDKSRSAITLGKEKEEEAQKPSAKFIRLPNTFTPNNDGVNDYFFIEASGVSNYILVVLDEGNRVVWQTNNENEKWDGLNLGGEKVPVGNYIYYITAEDEKGERMNTHQRLLIQ
jgi:gliding motility-associated-like protein